MLFDDADSFLGTERFRVVRRLGDGAFGVVFEVHDREHDALVALKVLRTQAPDAIARFKREFRALADLTHPNLVVLHELAFDGSRWFFTMERVRGVTLLEHARGEASTAPSPLARSVGVALTPRSPLAHSVGGASPTLVLDSPAERAPPADSQRLRSVIGQLAAGLAALHRAGRLHRDVKPSNALVTADGRVVLLDFGLVTELSHEADAPAMGTPAYMSPEQALGKPLTSATDMYSVGVILYQALAGELPFSAQGWEALAGKLVREAPDVARLAPDAPEDLRSLCGELLALDPSRRPSAAEVERRLAHDHRPSVVSPRTPSRTPFIGREHELVVLRAKLDALDRADGCVAWVHGPSGVGKTALTRQLLDQARARGMTVLAGRCYEQERLPYKTLDGVVDALVEQWSSPAAATDRHYVGCLPDDAGALARLFPALSLLPEVAAQGPAYGDPQELRRRAFAAFREMLGRIARHERLVVFVDDLHWGDVDGAQLLAEALRPPTPPLMFLGAFRSDARATSPALCALEQALGQHRAAPALEVALAALSLDEGAQLAAAMVPGTAGLPREVRDRLVQESAGLPLLLGELVRLASSEGIEREVDEEEAALTPVVRVVAARLRTLPDEARELLRALAFAGQPVPLGLARAVSGVADEPTAFSALRASGLVRVTAGQSLVEPYHDRIRETVLSSTSAADAAVIHSRFARALEGQGGVEPERVAHHFDAAGERESAARWAECAADHAYDVLAFDHAARLYARTLELLREDARGAHAARLLERRGDALANAGRSANAADAFAAAARELSGDAALNLERKSAEHLLRAGLLERGVGASRALLARLGVALPSGDGMLVARLGLERARLSLRGLSYRPRTEGQCDPRDLLRFDTCSALSAALSHGEPMLAAFAHARAMRMALDLGEPTRVHRALVVEAAMVMAFGLEGRTREIRARIEALAPHVSPYQARAPEMLDAVSAYFEGRWRDALDLLRDNERYLVEECRGVAWELDTVRAYLLASLHLLGELPELLGRVDGLVADAEARGDVYHYTTLRVLYTCFAGLVRDDPALARAEIDAGLAAWGQPGFTVPHFWAAYGRVEASLYEGDGVRAWHEAQALWQQYRRSLLSRIEYQRALAVYLHGRAALACARSAPAESEARLAFAQRASRKLEQASIPWARAASRMLLAGVANAQGDGAAVVSALNEAVTVCDAHGFLVYAASARRALAMHQGDRDVQAAAELWLGRAGVRDPVRFAYVFAPAVAPRDDGPITARSLGKPC
jgi:serine/threonine protein kinase